METNVRPTPQLYCKRFEDKPYHNEVPTGSFGSDHDVLSSQDDAKEVRQSVREKSGTNYSRNKGIKVGKDKWTQKERIFGGSDGQQKPSQY